MGKKPSKKTPKNITIDELAAMSQREFSIIHDDIRELRQETEALRKEMYQGFKELREEMREGFSQLRKAISDLTLSIRALSGEIADMKDRQEDHEQRIRRLERAVELAK